MGSCRDAKLGLAPLSCGGAGAQPWDPRDTAAGDHSQVLGQTPLRAWEAEGIPWPLWGLVLCFRWPQSAAAPLGTLNLPRRRSREGEPCARPQSNEPGLVEPGLCQDVPQARAAAHGTPACRAVPPTPRFWTVPASVLMLPDAAAFIPPQSAPLIPGLRVSPGTSGWQRQRADTPVPAAPSRGDGTG